MNDKLAYHGVVVDYKQGYQGIIYIYFSHIPRFSFEDHVHFNYVTLVKVDPKLILTVCCLVGGIGLHLG